MTWGYFVILHDMRVSHFADSLLFHCQAKLQVCKRSLDFSRLWLCGKGGCTDSDSKVFQPCVLWPTAAWEAGGTWSARVFIILSDLKKFFLGILGSGIFLSLSWLLGVTKTFSKLCYLLWAVNQQSFSGDPLGYDKRCVSNQQLQARQVLGLQQLYVFYVGLHSSVWKISKRADKSW